MHYSVEALVFSECLFVDDAAFVCSYREDMVWAAKILMKLLRVLVSR